MHDMFVSDDGLSSVAEEVIKLRNAVDDLPKTCGTFRLRQLNDVNHHHLDYRQLEFIGCWPLYGSQEQHRATLYVNPDYVHAETLSDLVVECECGASFVYYYDMDEDSRIDNAHAHADDCLPFQRLRARADLHEKRYEKAKELYKLGWTTSEVARRFGISQSQVVNLQHHWGIDVPKHQNEYRQEAAETYETLVHGRDVSSATVGELYGVSASALSTWKRRFVQPTEVTV